MAVGRPASRDVTIASSLRTRVAGLVQQVRDNLSHGALTDIEAPHVFETSPVIAATKYPRHIVSKGDGVRTKTVGRECTPDWGLTPVHHRRRRWLDARRVGKMRNRAVARGKLLHGWTWWLGGDCSLAGSGGKRVRTCGGIGRGEAARRTVCGCR